MDVKQKGMLMILSAYSVNGIANFNIKDLEVYCSHNVVTRILTELEELGEIECLSKNGYLPRYKINSVLECPNYLFNTKLTLGDKTTLLKLQEIIDPNIYYSQAELCKLCGKNITRSLKAIKERSGIYWKDILLNNTQIKVQTDLNGYINTEFGYIYAPKEIKTLEDIKVQKEEIKKRDRESFIKRVLDKTKMAHTLWINHKNRHRVRNIKDFTITEIDIQDILEQQDFKCYYTGLDFSAEDQGMLPSIDRIDSSRGYTKDNIVVCLGCVNIMKNILPIEKFLKMCRLIAQNHNI